MGTRSHALERCLRQRSRTSWIPPGCQADDKICEELAAHKEAGEQVVATVLDQHGVSLLAAAEELAARVKLVATNSFGTRPMPGSSCHCRNFGRQLARRERPARLVALSAAAKRSSVPGGWLARMSPELRHQQKLRGGPDSDPAVEGALHSPPGCRCICKFAVP